MMDAPGFTVRDVLLPVKFIQPVNVAGLATVTVLPAVLIVQAAVSGVEMVPPDAVHCCAGADRFRTVRNSAPASCNRGNFRTARPGRLLLYIGRNTPSTRRGRLPSNDWPKRSGLGDRFNDMRSPAVLDAGGGFDAAEIMAGELRRDTRTGFETIVRHAALERNRVERNTLRLKVMPGIQNALAARINGQRAARGADRAADRRQRGDGPTGRGAVTECKLTRDGQRQGRCDMQRCGFPRHRDALRTARDWRKHPRGGCPAGQGCRGYGAMHNIHASRATSARNTCAQADRRVA